MAKPIKLKTEPKEKKKKKNPKMWRPHVITDDVVKKLVEEFRYDATVEEACSYAWISIPTFYDKLKNDKDFFNEIDRAIKFPFKKARNTLIWLMDSDKEEIQYKSAQEFLSKRDSRYKAKSENTETTLSTPESQEDLIRNKSMIDLEEMRKKLLG